MPQVINIEDSDIEYAEKILLPPGKHFSDAERLVFIINLQTIDLQAVPGSGKTTALLAKLLILEKQLPFGDGSGILVLSHTNAAIDEIKHKIYQYCPLLFSYPNFVGTVQSFVDRFLAIPWYGQIFKTKPFRIDADIYDKEVEKYYRYLPDTSALKKYLKNKHEPLTFLKQLRFDTDLNLISTLDGKKETFDLKNNTTASYTGLKNMKIKLLKQGYLHYDDAYFIANLYLNKRPNFKQLLQKRFSYVFVDEMQDIDKTQYQLLERIFFDNGTSTCTFQRIGDKNQAIYNSVKEDSVWVDRGIPLLITGSQRLSAPVAKMVTSLAVERPDVFAIAGLQATSIKPHLLIFDNTTVKDVIPFFASVVKRHQKLGQLPDFNKYPIKAIAWNTEWGNQADKDNPDKIRLTDYCNDYSRTAQKPKTEYVCLWNYLIFYDKSKASAAPIRSNILNALVHILRIEEIESTAKRIYTADRMLAHIKEFDPEFYDELKLKIYNWIIGIRNGQTEIIYEEIKNFLPKFLKHFSETAGKKSSQFIANKQAENQLYTTSSKTTNKVVYDDIQIEVGSVHSVKGQTHCATLYLESFYSKGYGSYESDRLRNQLSNGQSIPSTIAAQARNSSVIKQSARMAYVGCSRPTNLLCFAIHKSRFDAHFSKADLSGWEVIAVKK